jgi:hypothetical protein
MKEKEIAKNSLKRHVDESDKSGNIFQDILLKHSFEKMIEQNNELRGISIFKEVVSKKLILKTR